MASAKAILDRLEKAFDRGLFPNELLLIRAEIQADEVSRGKIKEYDITQAKGSEQGKFNRAVTGIPFGDSLAVRKQENTSYEPWAIDHIPTGLRLSSFPSKKLASLVAATLSTHATSKLSSGDASEAVGSMESTLKAWLMSVKASGTWEDYDAFKVTHEALAA